MTDREALVTLAREQGVSIATAESLTGGAVSVALAEVPGVSDVLRGGVVAYAIEVKRDVLGVEQAALDLHGPVSREVVEAMATGVRRAMGARMGLATTGAAGPVSHGGKPPGTVWIGVDLDGEVTSRELFIEGDRTAVTGAAVRAALEDCHAVLSRDQSQA